MGMKPAERLEGGSLHTKSRKSLVRHFKVAEGLAPLLVLWNCTLRLNCIVVCIRQGPPCFTATFAKTSALKFSLKVGLYAG